MGHQLHGNSARRQLPQSWIRQQLKKSSESVLLVLEIMRVVIGELDDFGIDWPG